MKTMELNFDSENRQLVSRVCFNFVIAWIVLTLLLARIIGTEILRAIFEGLCSQTRGHAEA
jgi:hypothetical protein